MFCESVDYLYTLHYVVAGLINKDYFYKDEFRKPFKIFFLVLFLLADYLHLGFHQNLLTPSASKVSEPPKLQ